MSPDPGDVTTPPAASAPDSPGARSTPTDEADPQRWILLAGLWAMYAAFGLVVSSLAPVLTPLGEDLGLSKSRLGVILGTWPAVFVFASTPSGWFLDRVGLRWALFAGGVLMCLSGVLRGLATGGVSLFLAVAVFGLGAPMISNAAPKLVVSRFSERERAKATSLYLTAPVAGQIIAVAAANSVIRPVAGGSWRSVPLVLAAATGIVCVLWLMLTGRLESRSPGPAPGGFRLDSATRQGARTLLRQPLMRLVLVMAVAIFFVNHGLNNWLPKIIEDSGVSAQTAGYLTSASYAAGLIGPLLVTRFGARRPLAAPVVISLCLAATVAMLAVVTGVAATPFLLLIGFLRFGLIALCVLTLMGLPGVDGRNMGIASGLFFTAGEIGGFGGPFAVGGIADASGSFAASLFTLAAAMVLVAWLFLLIRRRAAPAPPRPPGEPHAPVVRGGDPADGRTTPPCEIPGQRLSDRSDYRRLMANWDAILRRAATAAPFAYVVMPNRLQRRRP